MKPVLDHVKVENGFQEVEVIGDGVDDGNLERAVGELASLAQVKLNPKLAI